MRKQLINLTVSLDLLLLVLFFAIVSFTSLSDSISTAILFDYQLILENVSYCARLSGNY